MRLTFKTIWYRKHCKSLVVQSKIKRSRYSESSVLLCCNWKCSRLPAYSRQQLCVSKTHDKMVDSCFFQVRCDKPQVRPSRRCVQHMPWLQRCDFISNQLKQYYFLDLLGEEHLCYFWKCPLGLWTGKPTSRSQFLKTGNSVWKLHCHKVTSSGAHLYQFINNRVECCNKAHLTQTISLLPLAQLSLMALLLCALGSSQPWQGKAWLVMWSISMLKW